MTSTDNPNPETDSVFNPEQLFGPIRALAPFITSWLVARGLDDVSAGLLAGGVVLVIMAVWSVASNRLVKIVKQVGKIEGVQVQVSRNAPQQIKEIAHDDNVPGVVPTSKV